FAADFFRRLEFGERAGDGEPVITLHRGAFLLRDGHGGHGAIRALVAADETVGVGEDLDAGSGIEAAAVGVMNAGIDADGRLFGAAGVVDAVGGGERIDVVVIEIEIGFDLTELFGLRNGRERIFGRDAGEVERGADHLIDAGGGKIAGPGAGGALSEEDANTDGAGAGLLEGFDFAETDGGGKLGAVADDDFGGGGAALHGAADDV